jgi:hypothetical protein
MVMKNAILWNEKSLLAGCVPDLIFDPEDRGITFLRNIGGFLLDYAAAYPTRNHSSKSYQATRLQISKDSTPPPPDATTGVLLLICISLNDDCDKRTVTYFRCDY